MTHSSPPSIGVSIAVFRNGRVLLATRTKPPFQGAYSLPGGHVEAGETLEQAALRELREEVDIAARIIGFNRHIETIRWENAGELGHHYVIASFVGVWLSGEAKPGPEAGAILWATPEELRSLPTTPELATIVADAAAIFARCGGG